MNGPPEISVDNKTPADILAREMKRFLIPAIVFLAAIPVFAQEHYVKSSAGPALLPDKAITPGVIRTSKAQEICAKSFRTAPFRKTTEAMKNSIYKAYGAERGKGICKGNCEVDHKIPLELGGADVLGNLWIQPPDRPGVPGWQTKDKFENYLHKEVCAGHVSLLDAQHALMDDWFAEFKKVKQ